MWLEDWAVALASYLVCSLFVLLLCLLSFSLSFSLVLSLSLSLFRSFSLSHSCLLCCLLPLSSPNRILLMVFATIVHQTLCCAKRIFKLPCGSPVKIVLLMAKRRRKQTNNSYWVTIASVKLQLNVMESGVCVCVCVLARNEAAKYIENNKIK